MILSLTFIIALVASVQTNMHFTALAWTKLYEETENHSLGFITGGMLHIIII